MKMKKRTNSVISSMYHPLLGNSRFKTAACMFGGGAVLVCLGVGLIVTTLSAHRRPPAHGGHVDETSVLISGPTCLVLGLVVAVLSGADMCRYRRHRNSVESELVGRVMMGGGGAKGEQQAEQNSLPGHPKVAIVINKSMWPT